jgi:hypothetical protein
MIDDTWDPTLDEVEWVQLSLDLEILLWCDCCRQAEVETYWEDGRLVCYPCAYHLAN